MNDRILVAAPTAAAKNYCFEAWLDNVLSFKYPNFIIRLFDNTTDDGQNAKHLNEVYNKRHGINQGKFLAVNLRGLEASSTSVIQRMMFSHNCCVEYIKGGNFDYLLHLETDVFPEPDVIERLLAHRKQIIGAVYFRDEGQFRKPMLQTPIELAPNFASSQNVETYQEPFVFDGKVKPFASIGLGCVLIHKSVFDTIKFRYDPNRAAHPDTFFSEDCLKHGIEIFADTSLICRHDNRPWGMHGIDFR